MPNVERLRKTVEEIETDAFLWSQESWVDSDVVSPLDGIKFEDLPSECGTSYCFAGRVASVSRELLFRAIGSHGYTASEYFIPVDGESGDADPGFTGLRYRAVENDEGYAAFELYEGPLVSARGAAIRDLELTGIQADELFSEHNGLRDVQRIVDLIVEGDTLEDYDSEEYDEN